MAGPPVTLSQRVLQGCFLFASWVQGSGRLFGTLVLASTLVVSGASAQVQFASKHKAFTQGYSAYKSRRYDIAVPALKFAAKRNVMRAKYYLAKIYSDNSGGFTNHARAYLMLRQIVSDHAQVDPKDFRVAPFVSKALISIARYERDGISALQLRPNTQRALLFFDHAASHFNDQDAQFELAKHYLAGDGVEARVPYALNWLARLSKRGHAGAQAFLANLYWNGRYTVRDRVRALALITVAVENASEEDRFWIEDLHHNIFCEASRKTRLRVQQVVGGWRKRFGRTRLIGRDDSELMVLGGETKRVCANGDIVGVLDAAPANNASLNGFTAATAAGGVQRESQSETHQSRPGMMMTRMKRDETDRSRLNGFSGRSDGDRSAAESPSLQSDFRAQNGKRQHRDKRSLNGFVLQGTTNFGFSAAPNR